MRTLLSLLLFLLGFTAYSQKKDNRIVIGTIDSLPSKVLKETRAYWVYLPPSYSATNKNNRYPVMYLLDGDAHFHSVSGIVHQMATGINGNSFFPEMIIVAIPNTDRARDLTPSNMTKTPDGHDLPPFLRSSGGGDNFISFLRTELIPGIESKYLTAPFRILVGHSFGGLLAVHALVNHSDLFNAYIAIDPSMSWDNQKLLKHAQTVLATKKFNNRHLFLSVANTMPRGMKIEALDKDSSGATDHIRSIRQLISSLERNNSNGLRWSHRYWEDEGHSSVVLLSEYYGLRFIFENYNLSEEKAMSGLDSLKHHYASVSKMLGYTVLPPEGLVNQLGYIYLQMNDVQKAIDHFSLNVANYPSSANVYDSLGDAYLQKGDKAKAREAFQNALRIDPDYTMSREKLKGL